MLQSSVDLMLLQHLIHFGVKRMTRRLGNLVGAHPQTFLLRLTLTHRHAFMTSKTFWRSHGLDFYHGLLDRSAENRHPSRGRQCAAALRSCLTAKCRGSSQKAPWRLLALRENAINARHA